MSTKGEEIKTLAEQAVNDERLVNDFIEKLSGSSRRDRQAAASVIGQIAKLKPQAVVSHIDALIDALNRPEAQTRWECLEVLAILVDHDSRSCSKAMAEAEAALFDEESGPVRLAAMRFLCKLGATTAVRSEKCWPLIDEGIQCYHGDLEFNDMLNAIVEFSDGKLSDEVKEQLVNRMSFDAENGKGTLQRRAQQIIANVNKK